MVRRTTPVVVVTLVVAIISACGGQSSRAAPTSATTSAAPARSPAARPAAAEDWPTYHHDRTRAGVAPSGPPLGQVRRAWSTGVDGAVYAQPLVVRGQVIVASEANVVTALRASDGKVVWRTSLGTPVNGGSLPCGDIDPSGITGTPVADPAAGMLYVVAFLSSGPHHELFAIDLANGSVRWKRGIDAPGADPSVHQERGALALSRGRVYVAYGGLFGDCGPYHGQVVSVPASGPRGSLAHYRVPTQREGGIWAPPGPSIDSAGNLYVATGNGSSSTSFDWGNAVIRLSPGLREQSFFAPRNGPALAGSDTDLGSTSPVLLPGRRAFVSGKDGVGYLLTASRLGGIGHPRAARQVCGSAPFGAIAYSRGLLYVPCGDGLAAVRSGSLSRAWRQPAVSNSAIVAGPGVWAVGNETLFQLDPRNGAVRFSASIGSPARFASAAAAGGRVFVVAGGRVQAFSGG
jgi:outer membrane protein assembly factor BamB